MARKYNNDSINNNSRYGYIPTAKRDDEPRVDQRVDVNADLGFGFDVDINGSVWGRGQIDSKTVSGAPVTGAGSGRGHINFRIHLDGEAESEGEVKGMLARAFLKILS